GGRQMRNSWVFCGRISSKLWRSESGASLRLAKLKSYGKKELVNALAQYFERTADPAATLDGHDQKGRFWLPGLMSFPGRAVLYAAGLE
ncbi:MAG: hypothetical protein ABSC37_18985, partial [Xanthobacteraceae bacterium]